MSIQLNNLHLHLDLTFKICCIGESVRRTLSSFMRCGILAVFLPGAYMFMQHGVTLGRQSWKMP